MDINQFSNELKKKQREVEKLLRRNLPVVVGRMAKDFYQDNFRKSGFQNNGLHPWPATRRQASGAKGAASQYGPLLSSRRHLFSSIKYTPSDFRIVVSNDLPYAAIHNFGGETQPAVTPQMRRFAWAMYYKAQGRKKKATQAKRKPKNKASTPKIETASAQFWKSLALTRKKKLRVRIPQRQFIGQSAELNNQINERIENEINKTLNA